jgi:NarL family two-component system sensor histidine kinase LiaS
MKAHTKRSRFKRRFQQLQWKLMRSYVVVTVSTVLLFDLFSGALLWYFTSWPLLSPQAIAASARDIAAQLSLPLSPSTASSRDLLKQKLTSLIDKRMFAIVTTPNGTVLSCIPEGYVKVGAPLFPQTHDEVKTLAQTALAQAALGQAALAPEDSGGKRSLKQLSARDPHGNLLAAAPILDSKRQVTGLLFIQMSAPIEFLDFSRAMIATFLVSLLVVGLFAAVAGLGFGFLNARQLTRRLKVISDAADAWSQGEFSTIAKDESEDEIGQLARHLNQMAVELRELVTLRQNLATSEERNRLSRELHDTVKQQVFATTMQVGAARVLLDRDIDLARARLIEGERLAAAAQQELTAILEQLRPGSYFPVRQSDESLESALRAYVLDWSRYSGIAVEVMYNEVMSNEVMSDGMTSDEAQSGAFPVFSQATRLALLRITQEALANVVRHSHATQVQVQLNLMPPVRASGTVATLANTSTGRMVLTIRDNGQGFDPLQAGSGFGLQSMRERAEALPQGTLVVESRSGYGTRVEVACSGAVLDDTEGA